LDILVACSPRLLKYPFAGKAEHSRAGCITLQAMGSPSEEVSILECVKPSRQFVQAGHLTLPAQHEDPADEIEVFGTNLLLNAKKSIVSLLRLSAGGHFKVWSLAGQIWIKIFSHGPALMCSFTSEMREYAQFAYPENRHLRGTSDRQAKQIAQAAMQKVNKKNKQISWHRQTCEECKKRSLE
jgi:hypothetical protein